MACCSLLRYVSTLLFQIVGPDISISTSDTGKLEQGCIVCDEPVSALDVSIQAQILNLLMKLQADMGLTYLFITHDLSVVKHISDDIAVMYMGKCVEKAPSNELFSKPSHPYTKALLSAIPLPTLDAREKQTEVIRGEVSSPVNPKPGCRFAPRCKWCCDECTHSAFCKILGLGQKHS